MKKLSAVMLCVMMCFIASSSAWAKTVAINKTNFPDAVFREYVSNNFDTNKDGKLTDAEAKTVRQLNIIGRGIANLKGIEYFTALTNLSCGNNKLTSFDASKNIALVFLSCAGNKLTSLNTKGCKSLVNLQCQNNKLITLDLSSCTALSELHCNGNKLTSLNLSGCKKLSYLDCHDNHLNTLDVQGFSKLYYLDCKYNKLKSLNVKNCKKLTSLECYENRLTTFDTTGLNALTSFDCSHNRLTSLSVKGKKSLKILLCVSNNLTSLNVQNCTSLKALQCNGNELTTLNLKGCTSLEELFCYLNSLKTLSNLKSCPSLSVLNCYSNNLTELNVSGLTALSNLMCNDNSLASLNVKGCTALAKITCLANNLASLDVSGLTSLTNLYCQKNSLTSLNVKGCTALQSIECYENILGTLNVSGLTALNKLSCYDNSLTSLNVKKCTALESLLCNDNILSTLDVSNCIALRSLWCDGNLINSLDLSNIANLPDSSVRRDSNVNIVRTTKTKPTITTTSLPHAIQGSYYWSMRPLLIAYGTLPISWTATGLPEGLTCDDTGKITGTPKQTGTYTVTLKAQNSVGSTTKKVKLSVFAPARITIESMPNGTINTSYSVTFKATGSKTITWSASGLPAGLTINAKTGKISGKPTVSGRFGVYITATNAYGTDRKYFSIYINASTSSSSTAVNEMNTNSSTEAQTPETSSDSLDGKSSRSGAGNSSPGLRAETQTDGYIIAHVFDEVISVDKAGLYDFDVELDEDTPEDWTLVWVANSSEPSDDDEIADFFNSEGTPIEVVPSDKKITVSVWLNPNREYEPAIAVKK